MAQYCTLARFGSAFTSGLTSKALLDLACADVRPAVLRQNLARLVQAATGIFPETASLVEHGLPAIGMPDHQLHARTVRPVYGEWRMGKRKRLEWGCRARLRSRLAVRNYAARLT